MNNNNACRISKSTKSADLQLSIVRSPHFRWIGALDRAIAVLLLIPGTPLIGFLVMVVRMTSNGPGIFRQVRVGKEGIQFKMFKIRTMVQDAEAKTGPTWTKENDPRITFVGCVLRKLHLDELPQLFNVVRGEMALLGPRPERPELVHILAERLPGYLNRLSVPPGISGLAQINLPPDTDLASVRRKLYLDLKYVREANLFLDVRMLIWSCMRLIGVPALFASRLLGLDRTQEIKNHFSAVGSDYGVSGPDDKLSIERIIEMHQIGKETLDLSQNNGQSLENTGYHILSEGRASVSPNKPTLS